VHLPVHTPPRGQVLLVTDNATVREALIAAFGARCDPASGLKAPIPLRQVSWVFLLEGDLGVDWVFDDCNVSPHEASIPFLCFDV